MHNNSELIRQLTTKRQLLFAEKKELLPYADFPDVEWHIYCIDEQRRALYQQIGKLNGEPQ